MNNRLMRLRYGKIDEAYHLFHLVQLRREQYVLYSTRAESEYVRIGRVRKGLGGWRLRRCSEDLFDLPEDVRSLLTQCEPAPTYSVHRLDKETDTLEFLEERTTPFTAKEQGWTLPALLFWLAMVLATGWVALNRLDLGSWILSVAWMLSREQAEQLVWLALPLLSLLYLPLCTPSLQGVLYSVAFALTVLALPAVWKLQSPRLNIGFALLLLVGVALCGFTLWQSRKLRLPSQRLRERRSAFQLLGMCLAGLVVSCYGVVLPQMEPPPIAVSSQQQTAEGTEENAWDAKLRYGEEVIPLLDEERWREMDLQQRLDVLQQVVDYEAKWMLHCTTLPVQTREIEREETLAYYDGRAINLDRDNLLNRTAEQVLESALHELRHHYQYQVAAMLEAVETELPEYAGLAYFDGARDYAENIADYVSSEESAVGYYQQVMEQDARGYAFQRCEYYKQHLELLRLREELEGE